MSSAPSCTRSSTPCEDRMYEKMDRLQPSTISRNESQTIGMAPGVSDDAILAEAVSPHSTNLHIGHATTYPNPTAQFLLDLFHILCSPWTQGFTPYPAVPAMNLCRVWVSTLFYRNLPTFAGCWELPLSARKMGQGEVSLVSSGPISWWIFVLSR